ncbi:MAG: ABC-ATPase domain-containing protein [Spirochaetia bacterium]
MTTSDALKHKLESINTRDYGAYQALKGEYTFPSYTLSIDQIPKDPYAPPHTGVYRVRLKNTFNALFDGIFKSNITTIAFRDFLARAFYRASLPKSKRRRGTGYSGLITIAEPGQAILERNSVLADRNTIEARFFIGLPANGRRINTELCAAMLFEELPLIVDQALFSKSTDSRKLQKHIATAEDAEHLRAALKPLGLAAFIADNAVLPRKSGTSNLPLETQEAVPFRAPPDLGVEIELPYAGKIHGMGIPAGITLIVGGGYHGKSTLLHAVQTGIYNHIPGDGREQCAADPTAVKIRAYSGRYIEKTDISTFISDLPLQKDTSRFSTQNASGSTSQAAAIIEAIEAGAGVLLMDEDTCATNFMIRDTKMQKLVQKQDEPITTFIDMVGDLYRDNGISTILVLGGIGDYFDVSTTVIQMKNYLPFNVTGKAHEIAGGSVEKRLHEGRDRPTRPGARIPLAGCLDPRNAYNRVSVRAAETTRIYFGRNTIDLTDLEQLTELSQTKAIAGALLYLTKYMDGEASLPQIVQRVMADTQKHGLDILSDRVSGQFAAFRGLELAFALNRLRDLKII